MEAQDEIDILLMWLEDQEINNWILQDKSTPLLLRVMCLLADECKIHEYFAMQQLKEKISAIDPIVEVYGQR
jgi:hypothetical protein